jgi:5'(3')-deoxyribonucleotidase
VNTKKVVLCDQDGILADLTGKVLKRYNSIHNTQYTTGDLWSYHFGKVMPGGDIVNSWFQEPGFYRDLDVLPGAVKALQKLHQATRVVILTSPGNAPQCVPDKSAWLDEHFPFLPDYERIYTSRKELVRGAFLIDDAPKNLLRWKEQNPEGQTIAIKYKYNKQLASGVSFMADGYDDTARAWKDIVDYILESI